MRGGDVDHELAASRQPLESQSSSAQHDNNAGIRRDDDDDARSGCCTSRSCVKGLATLLDVAAAAFAVLTVAINLADVATDVVVAVQFQREGEPLWFGLVVGGMAVAHLVYAIAATLILRQADGWRWMEQWPWPIRFAFFLLIAQLLPLINLILRSCHEARHEAEFGTSTADNAATNSTATAKTSAAVQAELDAVSGSMLINTRAAGAFRTHLEKYAFFYIESAVEAAPQAIIQLLAITFLGRASPVQLVSLCCSLFSITSKAVIISQAYDARVMVFKFALAAHDVFSTFYLFSTLVAQETRKDTSFSGLEVSWIGYIWLWKAVVLAGLIACGALFLVGDYAVYIRRSNSSRCRGLLNVLLCFVLSVIAAGPVLLAFECMKLVWILVGLEFFAEGGFAVSAPFTLIAAFLRDDDREGSRLRHVCKAIIGQAYLNADTQQCRTYGYYRYGPTGYRRQPVPHYTLVARDIATPLTTSHNRFLVHDQPIGTSTSTTTDTNDELTGLRRTRLSPLMLLVNAPYEKQLCMAYDVAVSSAARRQRLWRKLEPDSADRAPSCWWIAHEDPSRFLLKLSALLEPRIRSDRASWWSATTAAGRTCSLGRRRYRRIPSQRQNARADQFSTDVDEEEQQQKADEGDRKEASDQDGVTETERLRRAAGILNNNDDADDGDSAAPRSRDASTVVGFDDGSGAEPFGLEAATPEGATPANAALASSADASNAATKTAAPFTYEMVYRHAPVVSAIDFHDLHPLRERWCFPPVTRLRHGLQRSTLACVEISFYTALGTIAFFAQLISLAYPVANAIDEYHTHNLLQATCWWATMAAALIVLMTAPFFPQEVRFRWVIEPLLKLLEPTTPQLATWIGMYHEPSVAAMLADATDAVLPVELVGSSIAPFLHRDDIGRQRMTAAECRAVKQHAVDKLAVGGFKATEELTSPSLERRLQKQQRGRHD